MFCLNVAAKQKQNQGNKTRDSRIHPQEETYLRKRFVAVVLANLGTGAFDIFVKPPPERSPEWCPGLNQYVSFVVFGNHVTGVIRHTIWKLIDDWFNFGLLQDTIELLGRKV